NNTSAPLNVSGVAQSKSGGLLLNTGGAVNALIIPSGNVGIGAVAPGAKLDIAGTIGTALKISDGGDLVITSQVSGPNTTFYNDVGILNVNTDFNVMGKLCINGDCKGGWDTSSASYWTAANNGKIYYTGGAVGIGTTDPKDTLDVQGNIRVSGNGNIVLPGGNIGFGIGTPTYFIDILTNRLFNGGVNIKNTNAPASVRYQGLSILGGKIWKTLANRDYFSIYSETDNANRLTINNSGNVGIGTDDPGAYKLYVNGSAAVKGDLTADNLTVGNLKFTGLRITTVKTSGVGVNPAVSCDIPFQFITGGCRMTVAGGELVSSYPVYLSDNGWKTGLGGWACGFGGSSQGVAIAVCGQ
ncbi:MAG: Uncharacterized protein Athens071426_148, partial [Parcubacteria group bacterium Athens0714_26]